MWKILAAAEGELSGFEWFNSNVTFGQALLIFVLGFLFVFIVLALLVGLVYLIRLNIRRKKAEQSSVAPAALKTNGISDEEVAAVMAALTAYFEVEKVQKQTVHADDAPPFVVRSIIRK